MPGVCASVARGLRVVSRAAGGRARIQRGRERTRNADARSVRATQSYSSFSLSFSLGTRFTSLFVRKFFFEKLGQVGGFSKESLCPPNEGNAIATWKLCMSLNKAGDARRIFADQLWILTRETRLLSRCKKIRLNFVTPDPKRRDTYDALAHT